MNFSKVTKKVKIFNDRHKIYGFRMVVSQIDLLVIIHLYHQASADSPEFLLLQHYGRNNTYLVEFNEVTFPLQSASIMSDFFYHSHSIFEIFRKMEEVKK